MRADVFQSVLGIVSWSVDLTSYIIDELFTLSDLVKPHLDDHDFVEQMLQSLNSPALPLILISASRTFLKYNCRVMRGLSSFAQRSSSQSQYHASDPANNSTRTPAHAFLALDAQISQSPVPTALFEKLLGDIESKVRKAYNPPANGSSSSNAAPVSEAERARLEKEMLLSAAVPDVFMPVVRHLLTAALDHLRAEIDPAAVYFRDVAWLRLDDATRGPATDAATGLARVKEEEDFVVDAIRKLKLPVRSVRQGKVRLRRCARCASVMEDVIPARGNSMWMTSMQRMCFCGSLWVLLGEGETV